MLFEIAKISKKGSLMFNGLYFSYDGVPSEQFGIKILDFDGTGKFETNILSATVSTTRPARSPKFFRVGAVESEPTPFTLSIVSETALDGSARRAILSWLYKRNDFKEFRVYQPDLENYYYKAIFHSADAIYISGNCVGFVLAGVFDSPYQYGVPTIASTAVTGTSVSDSVAIIDINNNSDIPDGYVYPIIRIINPSNTYLQSEDIVISEMKPGTSISTGREMAIAFNIPPSCVLTIDNAMKTIKWKQTNFNGSGTVPLSDFSGTWTRLAHGANRIKVTGLKVGWDVEVECPDYALVGF